MGPTPYSMQQPEGAGAPPAGPVFGAGPGDDPGYLASLRDMTVLGRMRLMMLVLVGAPLLILTLTPLIVDNRGGAAGDAPPWIYAPLLLAAAVAALAGPRAPLPMAPGAEPAEAARLALTQFRAAVMLRFALAEGVILLGLPLAMIGHAVVVFVAGFVVGYPLLLWLALPTRGGVERMRGRLESRGTESHLWAALLAELLPGGTSGRDTA
ncbi:hypothetical protein [Actinomadura violacea]|uniref:Uncharacterized protein n=1 Tax=Actinomadura violacea TaxID=2819934 RepID=A0ABS3S9G8_9ACTN|nr:hypothetical protein [Actinomadura violacea]MBO2465658.1 hypothetical protein [Actinomadura violacea]